jgi:hypothetical protein
MLLGIYFVIAFVLFCLFGWLWGVGSGGRVANGTPLWAGPWLRILAFAMAIISLLLALGQFGIIAVNMH